MVAKVAIAGLLAALLGPGVAAGQRGTLPGAAERPVDSAVWRIDKAHSELSFQIRHFLRRVRGTFREWGGTIAVEDPARWETASIDVAIEAASIFTDHERRDADLRAGEFFAADSFPRGSRSKARASSAGATRHRFTGC